MAKKLKGRALAKFEAGRDVWREVLDGVREIKSGGGKRSVVEPRSPIVRARLRARLTQEQFADASGFSQQYLSDLERGRRNPTVVTLFELADALGASHIELVAIDEEFEREFKARGKPVRSGRRTSKPTRHRNAKRVNRRAARAR